MASQSLRCCFWMVFMFFLIPTIAKPTAAQATELEKWLIMPGPVISGHADVEGSCGSCHDPLSDQPQFELCISCHTGVGEDLENSAGFHGRLSETQRFECSNCHKDHEGRDMIIVDLDEAVFDHSLTDFGLSGAHVALACTDCHAAGEKHRDAPATCVGCHRGDDPHNGQLGEECDSCHNALEWSETRFDHNATAFPLTGMHASAGCTACHESNMFESVGSTCVACHQSDDVHKGRNGNGCADCHSADAWTTLTFDHLAVAGFRLDGGHRGLACTDCHNSSDFRDLSGGECNSCHRDDDVHETRNGSNCASCHGVSSWSNVEFDHERRTDVPLPPGHDVLECAECHKSNIHDPLPRSCSGCHASGDVHKGQMGTQCESCHVATSWTAELLFDHDLLSFPLIGAHTDVACDQCHASAAFHDAETYCLACHANDDPHGSSFGNQCADCHNPSTWQAWQFDHGVQTGFALSNGHAGIACIACHEASIGSGSAVSTNCNSCHSRDDPHFGRFGKSCDSCHDTSSFSKIEGM